jgi:xanthine dehydrogenase YagR molybdenum-binding subunit
VRLNRFVGAYDAGRILNPKTSRSQAIGGIIRGLAKPCWSSRRPIRRWGAS